jgi:hypothetical protein
MWSFLGSLIGSDGKAADGEPHDQDGSPRPAAGKAAAYPRPEPDAAAGTPGGAC